MSKSLNLRLVMALGVPFALCGHAAAQSDVDQFGGQARADAARDLIILGVQQAISSLPPTSGQSFTYRFDPESQNFEQTGQLGPTAFRSPLTIGKNQLSLRVAASYFALSETFDPISYLGQPLSDPSVGALSRLGLVADAHVGLFNFGISYGLPAAVEVTFNVPVTIVSAQVDQLSSTLYSNRNLPADQARLGVAGPVSLEPDRAFAIQQLDRAFNRALVPPNGPCDPAPDPRRCLTYRKDSVSSLGFDFNDGTHVGVGRIDLGFKWAALDTKYVQAALSLETFFASPNQDQFAGSESYSLLPRVIIRAPLPPAVPVHLLADAGYEYDFSVDQLRRFVWNAGASLPLEHASFDLGFGGSVFNQGIDWTPPHATGFNANNEPVQTLTALGDTSTGTTFVDFIGGLKFNVADGVVLSGVVNVPINDEGFRPVAVGTIAAEYYF